jgi:hypothetical protein
VSNRIQLWSCGGGRQSAGIAAMIALGELPPPDHACMVRLEWEVASVWPYVERYIVPALERKGVPFTAIGRAEFATKDFWGGADGDSILLPVFSDQSGSKSKLPEYCSGEWKREVVIRWAAQQECPSKLLPWKRIGVHSWIGISSEEAHRRFGKRREWIQPRFPLLDVRPASVADCLDAVARMGWPKPPRSRCHHCPNQSDGEWAELTPEEWEQACRTDEHVRSIDPHAYLHKSLTPLRMVTLDAADNCATGGCSAGTCY